MGFTNILFYCFRAFIFSLAICFVYYLIRLIWLREKRGKFEPRKEALRLIYVFYLASLIEITVIRDGLDFSCLDLSDWGRRLDNVNIFPFGTLGNGSTWEAIYAVFGNILWFVPLGVLMKLIHPKAGWLRVFITSFSLSAAVEILQFIFKSGITDIDDIVFNLIGGMGGYFLLLGYRAYRKHFKEKKNS